MKRMTALLLVVCCLIGLAACGAKEPDPVVSDPTDAPSAPASDAPSASPEADEPVNGDEDMQLVWDIGDSVCPGFDTVMDRGTYTLAGVECRLFYYVKESRFAGEACVAPDKTVYVDLDGTLNWQVAEKNADGTYTLAPAEALVTPVPTPETTEEPEDSEDPEPTVSYTPAPTHDVSGTYVWPVDGYNIITFAYGAAHSDGRRHAGLDISGSDIGGQPVRAVADGVVNYAAYDPEGFGNYLTISHENGEVTFSMYAQLESITVAEGQSVSAGDVIGYVGMTGSATGYHLHLGIYETWDWESHFDPLSLFDGMEFKYMD